MKNLKDKKVAILTENGFEESELMSPREALQKAGATVHIISPQSKKVKGWRDGNWSIEMEVDKQLSQANPEDYDAIVIPGGVINPDLMRKNEDCVAFVTAFFHAGKPVASICHGPQLLIETGLIQNMHLTSYASIKTDLHNAGAIWEDKEVVVDNNLITSRSPEDLEAFNKKLLEKISEGVPEKVL